MHHCSGRSSIRYGEEDGPSHPSSVSFLVPPPWLSLWASLLAVTQKKKKLTLTINALARGRVKERKFPELSAYYYHALSAARGCSFLQPLFSSFPPLSLFSIIRLAFTAQQVEKGRQAFSELKPGHTQHRQGRWRRRQGWAVPKGAADKLTLVVLRSWRRHRGPSVWWREERAWTGRRSLLTR